MRRLLKTALLALGLCLASPVSALPQAAPSNEQLVAGLTAMHPAAFFVLADKLFQEGQRDEAVKWLYVGQIRYRFHLAANPGLDPSADPAAFSAFMEDVGRPLNEYAGGDVDGWLAAIDGALAWDAANPNLFTSKSTHAAVLERTRNGLAGLRRSLAGQRGEIARTRAQNGLENR